MSHTPGPWNVIPDHSHPQDLRITSLSRPHIAKVYAEGTDPDGRCEANAAVIAAAPETLEMLKELREQTARMREALLLVQRGIACNAIKCKPVISFGRGPVNALDMKTMAEIVEEALK